MAAKLDKEIEEYRNLMDIPDHYEEGFGVKSMLGVIFVAFVMVPASMYLQLLSGAQLGGVVQWVTIILFAEIAKRSFTTLRRQEIYVLFYVVSSVMAQAGGGGFGAMIFNQYLVRSPMAANFGIADKIPHWVVPPPDSPAIAARTFFSTEWLVPIALMVLFTVLNRLNMFGLGYTLFRVTSDREKLPFPFAPMQALGIMALADSTEKKETWRWRLFSIGAIMGMMFGFIYIGIPALTGAVLPKPVMILPIPFIDLTKSFESILPATPVMVSVNIWAFISASMLPFWMVIGQVAAGVTRIIVNPFILHRFGFLTSWERGMGAVETMMANQVDFYMSYTIGIQMAVALIGIYSAVIGVVRRRREKKLSGKATAALEGPPPGRGDYPIRLALALFLVSALVYVSVAHALVPNFPLIILAVFAFLVSPLQSYVDARLMGLVGRPATLPMVREATFLLSGYKGIDIWYMPWPMINVGSHAQFFRVTELTGTKITSIIKAELFMVPIILATSFVFWSFIWKLAPIPSPTYPFTQVMWPLRAMNACLWPTATLAKGNWCLSQKTPYELNEMAGHWDKRGGDSSGPTATLNGTVNQVALDPKGNRWFATDRGVVQFDSKHWTLYAGETGGGHGAVKSYDPVKQAWVDTDRKSGLPPTRVLSVFVQQRRYVWFGTDKGLARFDGKEKWDSWDEGDGMASSTVTQIAVDKLGRAWAGSDAGVSFFDGSRWTTYTMAQDPDLLSNEVTAIAIDKTGDSWIGTPRGLHRITVRGDVTAFTVANTASGSASGLARNHIRAVAIERVPLAEKGKEKSVFWLATDKGLSRWDRSTWQTFDRQSFPELASDDVTGIAVEPNTRHGVGAKWFSTAAGVVRYDERRGKWTAYQADKGLPVTPISFIVLSAGKRYLIDALRPAVISVGVGVGLVAYTILSLLGLPILLIYGYIGGVATANLNLMTTPLTLAGALAARYYFTKKYGSKQWRQYAMVMSAGYGCGNGLIAMFGVAVALIAKSISQLPF